MRLARSDFAVTCASGGAVRVCVGAESRVDGEESESTYWALGTRMDVVSYMTASNPGSHAPQVPHPNSQEMNLKVKVKPAHLLRQ